MNIQDRLRAAIVDCIDEAGAENPMTANLIAVAGEAVGHLSINGNLNFRQVMYDLARTAAGGGYIPSDVHDREERINMNNED